MSALLAILRLPAVLGLLLTLLVCSGCGQATARQSAPDHVPTVAQVVDEQHAKVIVEPTHAESAAEQPGIAAQPLLFADDQPEPYRPRGPPGLTFLSMFPAPLILSLDVRMPTELGIVVDRVVRGQRVVMWAAISPVGWRVGAVRAVGFRYYNPVTGRYISKDPAKAGFNHYAYASNNPVNRIDPLGLDDEEGGFFSRVAGSLHAIGNALASGVGLSTYNPQLQQQYNPLLRATKQGGGIEVATKTAFGVACAATAVASAPMAATGAKAVGTGLAAADVYVTEAAIAATTRLAGALGTDGATLATVGTGTALVAEGLALPGPGSTAGQVTGLATKMAGEAGDAAAGVRAAEQGAIATGKAPEAPTVVFRGGSGTADNLTPRPVKDADGLSTFTTLEAAAPPGGKAQVIDTTKLSNLQAIPNSPPGHVSIAPKDMTQMGPWAATRGTGETHSLTEEIQRAIIGEVKRPK
jgi:hypothetical protein